MLCVTAPRCPLLLLTRILFEKKAPWWCLLDFSFSFSKNGLRCSLFSEFSLSSWVENVVFRIVSLKIKGTHLEHNKLESKDWVIRGVALSIQPCFEYFKMDTIWKRESPLIPSENYSGKFLKQRPNCLPPLATLLLAIS